MMALAKGALSPAGQRDDSRNSDAGLGGGWYDVMEILPLLVRCSTTFARLFARI